MNTLTINKVTIPAVSSLTLPTGEIVNKINPNLGSNSMIVAIDQDTKPVTGKVYQRNYNTESQYCLTITDDTGARSIVFDENEVLAKTVSGVGFVKAKRLEPGDTIFSLSGWVYNPAREDHPWGFSKNFSPYLYGLLWALKDISGADWRSAETIDVPAFAGEGFLEELHAIGFAINSKTNKIDLYSGLSRIAKRNKLTIAEVIDLLETDTLINTLIATEEMYQRGFISGLQELFRNNVESEYDEDFIIPLSEAKLSYLYTIYNNLGEPVSINEYRGKSYLKVKRQYRHNIVYSHGLSAHEIVSVVASTVPVVSVDILTDSEAIMSSNVLVK